MSYVIKQEGCECNGVKLGQKCILEGEEYLIIGFDTSDPDGFIAVEGERDESSIEIRYSVADYILEGKTRSNYMWTGKDEITLLPFTQSDDSLPPEISPVHAQEILKDAIDETIILYSRLDKLYETIVKCGDIINQHN